MAGKVIKAAVMVGRLTCIGERHADIMLRLVKAGVRKIVMQDDQGFIDADGEWLTREEAYQRAVACGQIEDEYEPKKLLSGMVW